MNQFSDPRNPPQKRGPQLCTRQSWWTWHGSKQFWSTSHQRRREVWTSGGAGTCLNRASAHASLSRPRGRSPKIPNSNTNDGARAKVFSVPQVGAHPKQVLDQGGKSTISSLGGWNYGKFPSSRKEMVAENIRRPFNPYPLPYPPPQPYMPMPNINFYVSGGR